MSPALCRIGSAQLLAYSTISPCCTKISAGRSSWLCQGTMPPGSIVSLRKRSSRPSIWAGCFSRSIAPSVTSVTPAALVSTIARTLVFILSAGHSPAKAAVLAIAVPVMMQASARPCRSLRELAIGLNMSVSPLLLPCEPRCVVRLCDHHRRNSLATEMPDGCDVDSAALCVREHMLDVGRERRIGVDVVLELARGDAEPDRQAEDVDQLLAGMSDHMRPQDEIAAPV